MDNIWDRKSFEVGGHWPLWRGWKKRMTTQNRQSRTLFFFNKITDLTPCSVLRTCSILQPWSDFRPYSVLHHCLDPDSVLSYRVVTSDPVLLPGPVLSSNPVLASGPVLSSIPVETYVHVMSSIPVQTYIPALSFIPVQTYTPVRHPWSDLHSCPVHNPCSDLHFCPSSLLRITFQFCTVLYSFSLLLPF